MPTEDAAAEILFEEETEVEYNTERPEPENGQRREEEGGSFQCFISLFSNQRQKWIFVSEKGRRLVHVSILERGLGGRRKGGGRAEGAKWPQEGNNSGKGDGVHREGPTRKSESPRDKKLLCLCCVAPGMQEMRNALFMIPQEDGEKLKEMELSFSFPCVAPGERE